MEALHPRLERTTEFLEHGISRNGSGRGRRPGKQRTEQECAHVSSMPPETETAIRQRLGSAALRDDAADERYDLSAPGSQVVSRIGAVERFVTKREIGNDVAFDRRFQ